VRTRGISAFAATLAALVLLCLPGLARAATPSPPPVGAPIPVSGVSALSGVACGSATSCEAIGTTLSGAATTVAVTGGVPARAITVPAVPGPDELTLNAIACPSATTCEAVGSLTDASGDTSAVVVTIIRGVPSAPRAAPDSEAADGDDPSLTGVACSGPASCEAVGEGQDAVATEISTGSPSPLFHDQDPEIAQLSGIVCGGATCTALGSGSDGNGVTVAIVGGNLGATHVVDQTAALTAGACAAGGSCELLGSDADGDSVLVSDASGTLGDPAVVRAGNLTGISCETAATCAVTGASVSGAGLLLAVAGGTPGPPVAAPFGPSSQIACASPTTCLVAGSTESGAASITELGSSVDAVSLNVGGARVRGSAVSLRLVCQQACAGHVTETGITGSGRHARRVTLGAAAFTLPAGASRSVTLRLNRAGTQLLRREHALNVQLAVSTVVAGHADTVAVRAAAIGRARRPARRR
jgi:hypothetical protein